MSVLTEKHTHLKKIYFTFQVNLSAATVHKATGCCCCGLGLHKRVGVKQRGN